MQRKGARKEKNMKITMTDAGKVPVRAGSFGLFFEDINYSLDGGLYAQMLENRNFEAKDVCGDKDNFTVTPDGKYAWSVFPAEDAAAIKVKDDRPLFVENPHYLRIEAKKAGAGIVNKAYDGVYCKAGMRYKLSFWMRSYDYRAPVFAGVYAGGEKIFEVKAKPRADGKWHKYEFGVRAGKSCERAQFRFTLAAAGMLHVDWFSLMPEDAVLGIFRRDLAEMLRELKPGFLRFPGGCIVEGNTLANRYLWKNSVGQTERRRHNWSRWAVHGACEENGFRTDFSHYGQTLGVGYYEYFLLSEYLGAKPLPVLSVGIACQYMSSEVVPLGDPALETYIQEALDLVEFARGGKDTVWGRVRIEMGHPEPFALEYLGIGNEQWEADGNEFYKRFELFERRIHEKYPDIRIIGTAGPTVDSPSHKSAWEWTRKNLEENPDFVYACDEHFYVPPKWLYDNADVYDGYPRKGLVYAGEYAAHVMEAGAGRMNAPESNVWEGALAEAAFMTGMERNADVVVMKSYAPLLARLGYTQWSPDLIWFDGKSAYGSASYYVQKLYSLYTGDVSYKVRTDAPRTYASATSRDDLTFVKVVNAGEETLTADIEADFNFGELLRIVRMQGELTDYNTMEEPAKLAPAEIAPSAPATVELPPRSFQVLVFRR